MKDFVLETFLYDRNDITLTNDFQLVEQGVIDSMGLVRLVMFVEKEFGVAIDIHDMVLENFASIDAITALLLQYLDQKYIGNQA